MKSHNEILLDFDQAIAGSYERNEQVMNDIEFAKVPGAQWQGSDYDQFRNKPKPENNKIAKQVNRILGQYMRMEMNANIVSASETATDEDSDLLQSRWRNDFNGSDGVEALHTAADEAFHGGFGAFKLVAKYEDEELADENYQYITIEPIMSAASSVVFNAGAIRKDKQDAKQGWHLQRVNRKEIEEEFDVSITSFPDATSDLNYFDWHCDSSKDIYIAHYYEVNEKVVTEYSFGPMTVTRDGRKLTDNFGNKVDPEEFKLLKEAQPYEEKRKKVKVVEYALMAGDQFLTKPAKTPFKSMPIIPQYGYHYTINGQEFYCGEVCRQRDNQRFLNMGFGAMMEILAQPQVGTPEYAPEQIAKYASSHANRTVENYAFVMSDPIKDEQGNIVQAGPLYVHQPPALGQGLAGAIQFLNNNIDEQGGTGQSTLPSNSAAAAIQQVNDRQDDSYQPLYQNAMQAIKAACSVWIPAAQSLYFSNQRSLRVQGADGSYSQVVTMQYMYDPNMQMFGPFKNSARGRYEVSVKIGEAYKTKKEAERESNLQMLQFVDTSTPKGQMVINNVILATQGEGMEDAKRIARRENIDIMLSMGINPKPQNDEEEMYIAQKVQQIQLQLQMQANQPDITQQAIMAEAQARVMEGQAAIQNEVNDANKLIIDKQKADNDTARVQIQAAEAGVKIDKTIAETQGKQIENAIKAVTPIEVR